MSTLLHCFKLVYGLGLFGKVWTVQLNKSETDPYFLQNFQCWTMSTSKFCKICELNTEHEIVFVLIAVDSQGDITQV